MAIAHEAQEAAGLVGAVQAHVQVHARRERVQVLTLDLIAKGYRYAEMPITYGFRVTGRSFIRLGRYLRHVLPAIRAELNPDRAPNPSPRPRAG